MELNHAYCTADDLRQHLEDVQERLNEDLLIRACNAASRAIDNHTGTQFYVADTPSAKLFETTQDGELLVDPFASVDGFGVATDDAGDGLYAGNWPVTAVRRYPLNGPVYTRLMIPDSGGYRFPTTAPVQVTARWGYAEPPDDVVEATLLKAAGLFARKDAPFGVAAFGDFAAIRVTRQDPEVIELLRTYVVDVAMVA